MFWQLTIVTATGYRRSRFAYDDRLGFDMACEEAGWNRDADPSIHIEDWSHEGDFAPCGWIHADTKCWAELCPYEEQSRGLSDPRHRRAGGRS